MTEPLAIPAGERGTVRVFAVELPPEEAQGFAADPAAVARALGAPALDPAHVDVFPVSRIAALGLPALLAEGHGIPPAALEQDAETLAALDGHVVLVSSGAFGGTGGTLAVAPPLRLVGTYREEIAPLSFDPLPKGGAEGILAGPAAPPPATRGPRSGRAFTILLLILAILGFIVLNGGR